MWGKPKSYAYLTIERVLDMLDHALIFHVGRVLFDERPQDKLHSPLPPLLKDVYRGVHLFYPDGGPDANSP